jgi:hypothetical protein
MTAVARRPAALRQIPGAALPGFRPGPPFVDNPERFEAVPIDPAHLARSLGALDTLDVQRGFAGTLQQVLRSARTLFDADLAGLMLVDHAGALHWSSTSDRVVDAVAGDPDRAAQGPCRTAFAQRTPVAVRDLRAEPGWPALAQVGLDAGHHGALSVPVQLGAGPRWGH